MNEAQLSLKETIEFFVKNLTRLLIYSLVPFFLGIAIILIYKPLIYSGDKFYITNILVEDPNVINNTSEDFLFSAKNLGETLKRSNLSDTITLDIDFINSFKIINGHNDLNELTKLYLDSDLQALTRSLYLKTDEIDQFINELIADGNRFRAIIFDKKELNIGSTQVRLLMANLIDVINESIDMEYDYANINLKATKELEIDSPLTTIDVNQINNRLLLIRNNINVLANNYSSFAPEINLQVLLADLDTNEALFNYAIQESKIHKDILEKQIMLDIESLDKRIRASKEKLDFLQSNKSFDANLSEDTSSDATLNADSSFIDSIISLSSQVDNQEQKLIYIADIMTLENDRISLERRLSDLEGLSNFELSFEEAKKYLFDSINQTSNQINEYIQIVKSTKKRSSIVQLSLTSPAEGFVNNIFAPIIMLIFGSFFFGLAILMFKFVMK